jgi:hypothetical protein
LYHGHKEYQRVGKKMPDFSLFSEMCKKSGCLHAHEANAGQADADHLRWLRAEATQRRRVVYGPAASAGRRHYGLVATGADTGYSKLIPPAPFLP